MRKLNLVQGDHKTCKLIHEQKEKIISRFIDDFPDFLDDHLECTIIISTFSLCMTDIVLSYAESADDAKKLISTIFACINANVYQNLKQELK